MMYENAQLHSILAMVLLSGIVWILIVYIRYILRKQRLLKKMNEVRRVPSDALAIMVGLTIRMPVSADRVDMDKDCSAQGRPEPPCGNRSETMENQLLNYV